MEVAAEVTRRSISPVQFHAVSCDVYYHICATYDIDGYPTLLGWKQGQSKAEIGMVLNEEEDIDADSVAQKLALDLAHEEVSLFDWETKNEEERKEVHEKMVQQGHKAAASMLSWHEHEPNTLNDRYHNAALSLAFAIKSQLFQTVTVEGRMDSKRKRALLDFLNLLDWASPWSWDLRTGLVKELQWKLEANAVKNRGAVEALVDGDIGRHRAGTADLWGFVKPGDRVWTGQVLRQSQREVLARKDQHWSVACTHGQPAKGFTCGLW